MIGRVHWASVVVAAVLTVFFLYAPTPAGCGCAARKRKLQELGGRIFGAP